MWVDGWRWAGPSVQFYLLVLSTGAMSHMGTLIGHIMQKCGADSVSGRNNGHDSAPLGKSPALKRLSCLNQVFVVNLNLFWSLTATVQPPALRGKKVLYIFSPLDAIKSHIVDFN